MTGQGSTGGDLTLLKVNLTPEARSTLERAAALTGETRTDVVNRALLLYSGVIQITTGHEGDYWVGYPDWDARGAVWLLVSRQRPKRRWRPW